MEFWLSILRVSVGKKVLGFIGSYSDYDLTRNKIAMVFNERFSKAYSMEWRFGPIANCEFCA